MAYATWLADVLRGAGLQVVEHPGWRTRGNGDYTDLYAVVWHHDASPPGDSPGVPDYMIRNFKVAGAQCWVDRAGAWHLVAAGVAYHAGAVLPGMPGNRQSIGVETDHTTGEDWPPALLRSLRVGTTAILRRLGSTPARGLHFHKTICSPPGRKVDPDRLDLATERAAVAATAVAGSRIPDLTSEEDDMTPEQFAEMQAMRAEVQQLQIHLRDTTPGQVAEGVWRGTKVQREVNGEQRWVDTIQELADAKSLALTHSGQIAALQSVVQQLAAGKGVDLDAVRAAARDGVADAIGAIETTVTITKGD